MARSRWDDALFAQAGACNPVALANSLVKHLQAARDEARESGGGTDAVRADPACRLITHQLAYLMGLEFGWSGNGYAEAIEACAARASPDVVLACAPEYAPKVPA